MKLLHIDSGILGTASISRQLSAAAVAEYKRRHTDLEVISRDLVAAPLNHLNGEEIFAAGADASQRGPDVQAILAESAKVLGEFLSADVIVVGAPMYNFGIPSQLKAWIDRIAVRGQTFAYTDQGPKGLAGGKTVIIASARGGLYGAGMPAAGLDHQENYLKTVFSFLGVTDIRFVRAEGLNMGAENKQRALEAAEQDVARLIAA